MLSTFLSTIITGSAALLGAALGAGAGLLGARLTRRSAELQASTARRDEYTYSMQAVAAELVAAVRALIRTLADLQNGVDFGMDVSAQRVLVDAARGEVAKIDDAAELFDLRGEGDELRSAVNHLRIAAGRAYKASRALALWSKEPKFTVAAYLHAVNKEVVVVVNNLNAFKLTVRQHLWLTAQYDVRADLGSTDGDFS